jgi:hypothetical protein
MYVKHPTLDGDGSVTIAMPDGTNKILKMVEGIIDWPEHVLLHNSFKPAPEPEALKELKRKEKEEHLRKLAEELGFGIQEPVEEAPKKAATKKKVE